MEFLDKVESYLKKGAKVSKEAFEKAGDKIQDFSDQSVIKVEIKKLENAERDLQCKLGAIAVKTFIDDEQKTLDCTSEEIEAIITEVKNIRVKIAEQKKELEKYQS